MARAEELKASKTEMADVIILTRLEVLGWGAKRGWSSGVLCYLEKKFMSLQTEVETATSRKENLSVVK